jgi:hypothetical protein
MRTPIPQPTRKSLEGEMKVNKVFGTPDIKGAMKMPAKRMSKAAVATRKKKAVTNAAGKLMGGLK